MSKKKEFPLNFLARREEVHFSAHDGMDPAILKEASKSQNENVLFIQLKRRVHTMKNVKVYGIDLAKNIFQLHGADGKGKKVLQKKTR